MLTTNTSSTNCRQIKIMKTRIFNYTTSFFLVTEAFTPIYLTHRSLTTRRLMSLISIPEAIAASKDDRNVFIDGSWYMPNTRNGREEFRVGPRVCGSRYFDIDNVCAPSPKNLPHMKPTSKQFSLAMDLMNISSDNTLYIYANKGCGFVHRAYWTFRSGHDPNKVKLVQGSLDEWEDNGGQLEYTELKDSDDRMLHMPTDWESQTPKYKCYKTNNTIDMNVVMDIVNKKSNAIIVDARSHGRFIGKDPEPRPGLRGGHMPNALNVPFASLLREDDMTKFKSMDRVKQIFIEAGIKPYEECTDNEKKVVCSCGSGVTAATLAIGLEECGLRKREDIYIYDGSWIEWGGDTTTPIIKDVSV